MKNIQFFLFIVFIALLSCTNKTKEINIQNVEVLKDSLVLNGNKGIWYYKNQPFTGYSVKYHANDTLMQKVGFYNGKKEGVAKTWFNNGVLKLESHYKQNKLEGSYISWWNNGVLAMDTNYTNGKLQGIQKQWYYTGVLAKQRNLVDGKENGIQQAWLKNGKMYVNYEAKNGRIFGMRRANSCYQLENEVIITKK